MKYNVIWKAHAERRLATIWNDSENRQAIAAAANEVDRALASSPVELGESPGRSLNEIMSDLAFNHS